MIQRLPTPGQDNNTWGDILNGFLQVAHNSDGTLQGGAISQAGGITSTQVGAANGVAGLDSSGQVPITQLGTGTGNTNNFLRGDGTWAIPNGSGVTTFNTRTGAVTSQSGDYTFSQVGAAQALVPTAVKTSAYTASPGDFVPIDASSGSVTITLPTAPADKSRVEIKMVNTSGSNTVTINTGGSDVFNKSGGSTSAVLTLLNQALMIQYAASGGIWYVQSDDLPLSQLDGRYALFAQPWQFYVSAYGAKGDGKIVTDAVMNSSANLACTTSTPFTSADVGKSILVSTAKGSYTHLMSTINTYGDSGHVVLANSATANTGGTPGAIAYYGTDDTSAIQSAINAATSYAASHNGYAEVIFNPVIYIIAGGFITNAAGNNQIALPIVPATSQKVNLVLRGAQNATPLLHWNQLTPQASGAVLASVRTDGSSNGGGNGPAHIIGGPVTGYGGEPGTYSNTLITVSGLATLSPYNATFGGMDLFGMAEADIQSFSAMTAAVVPTSSAPVPTISSVSNISNLWGWGLRMPSTGNNALCHVGQFSCEGHCYGFGPSEHTVAESVRCLYNVTGIEAYSGNGVSMVHNAHIMSATVEACTNATGYFDGGIRLDIDNLEAESIGGKMVYDPSNRGQGTILLRDQGSSGSYNAGFFNNGVGMRIVNMMTTPGPVASPQAAPATTVAWPNYYYRDAWITVSLSGGTFTSLTIDSVAQSNAAGVSTYSFILPAGHSYTPTYSAGTLTHTVTLM